MKQIIDFIRSFRYRPTPLVIAGMIHLYWVFYYTIFNHKVLTAGEGWGGVAMLGLGMIGIAVLLIDLVLQFFIRGFITQMVISSLATIAFIYISATTIWPYF